MNPEQTLRQTLQRSGGKPLNVSARGTGLNALWMVALSGAPLVIKTYSRRRSPGRTALSHLAHVLSGRTGYTAGARWRTERANLALWRQAGFDVPRVFPERPAAEIPLPHVCMEYVAGTLLSEYLADPDVPAPEREAVFIRFAHEWAARHARADRDSEIRLIQEHGTIEHVMLAGDRLVTFDLEVSYRDSRHVRYYIAEELCAYVRSLFRTQSLPMADHLLGLLVRHYPERQYLASVCAQLLRGGSRWGRAARAFDRRYLRHPGKMHKYRAAQAISDAMARASLGCG